MLTKQTQAVVLRVMDHSESDKIVTFFCPVFGKMNGIAKGAKRSKKRFVNKLELFSLLELSFVAKHHSSLAWIDQAELITSHASLRLDYKRYLAASLICELMLYWTKENDGDPELFELLLWTLEKLEQGSQAAKIIILFQLKMLGILGYRPNLSSCLRCGRQETAAAPFRFLPAAGGIHCCRCGSALPSRLHPLSLSTVKLLALAQTLPLDKLVRLQFSPASLHESLELLQHYSIYLLQRDIFSYRDLEKILCAP